MKLSSLALKPLRLGARITSLGKLFQKGVTLFEKKMYLESTALPMSFLILVVEVFGCFLLYKPIEFFVWHTFVSDLLYSVQKLVRIQNIYDIFHCTIPYAHGRSRSRRKFERFTVFSWST